MINDRIAFLINSLGITKNKFSNEIKVSAPVIHNIIKARRSKPSFEILSKILTTYKEVNADWLLRGEGEVWRKHTEILRSYKPNSKELETKIIRLIDKVRNRKTLSHDVLELSEMAELLIDENHEQQRKMIKLFERQEEIIETLKKLKVKL